MDIQIFEHEKYWRARLAGKGWKSFQGRSMAEAIGHVLWYYQAQFEGKGVAFQVNYLNGAPEYWGVDGTGGEF